ncbi:MAG: ABC transporter permease [Ignavibacteriaceae bacterium]
MFNKRTLGIIKRELRARLLSRSFILTTVLIPVFLLGILAVQTFLIRYHGDEKYNLDVVTNQSELTENFKTEFNNNDQVKAGNIKITYLTLDSSKFENHLTDIKPEILKKTISGVLYIPQSALNNKGVQYYSLNPNNFSLFNKLKSTINKVLVDDYFKDRKLTSEEIKFARNDVDFSGFKVTEKATFEKTGEGNTILAFLFTFLLYFALILIGTMMMRSVVEEKSNKIVEVLLSSVSSRELLTGKILGMSITAFIQMAIWLLPVFLLISTTWFVLPPEITLTIGVSHLFYFLFNFFIALITFLGLYATVGSIFDNDQDAQSGGWPLLILIMIPFFIAISMISNPESSIARIASFVPFASLIVMPARMTILDVPLWQIILSSVINVLIMISIFPVAGKIYRVGILSTGKRPKWSEVVKWLKYKY